MKKFFLTVVAFASLAVRADGVPTATVTSFAQDEGGRVVRIGYALANSPAIVTMSIERKDGDIWVPLSGASLRNMTGPINCLLREDGAYSVAWRPDKSWSDHTCAAGDLRVILKAWTLDDPPAYALFSMTVPNSAAFFENEDQLPCPVTDPLYRSEWLLMRRIPVGNGAWQVGSADSDPGRWADGEQLHSVKFSHDYYMGVFTLTRNQYDFTQGYKWGADRKFQPANNLNWQAFRGEGSDFDWPTKGHSVAATSVLGKIRALTGQDFDLPTEAQWEVACRAGTTTGLNNGMECTDSSVDDLAWSVQNSDGQRHPVGLKLPNQWGIYDMHGNVGEWCLDWMTVDRSSDDGKTDVTGPNGPDRSLSETADYRAVRGGSFAEYPNNVRSARRGFEAQDASYLDNVGGRLCLTLPLK